MQSGDNQLTTLLHRWSDGDAEAGERLAAEVYQQLKQMARSQLNREREGHTLQPTALVHEAYLKLVGGKPIDWQDRAHFFAVSSRVIRQILVDSGRARSAQRRDGGERVMLSTGIVADDERAPGDVDILALDQALEALAAVRPEQARVVELRYFGGLSVEEVAEVTGQSTATIGRHWRAARAWLMLQLGEDDPE
ncbi:MAG: sigma-70 family RNA polymerase sigma factor [Lysobacteraceae bacterium]